MWSRKSVFMVVRDTDLKRLINAISAVLTTDKKNAIISASYEIEV